MELFIINQNHSMIQTGPGRKSKPLEALDTLVHFTVLDQPPPNSNLLLTQSDRMLYFDLKEHIAFS
ncbi:hypothetical protein HispidOSU_010850 [Sigmodon hispidus]